VLGDGTRKATFDLEELRLQTAIHLLRENDPVPYDEHEP